MRSTTNVYFNKRSSKGRYRTGKFISKKNKCTYEYRSSYEFAFFTKLEKDAFVVEYVVEPFQVPYIDSRGRKRTYKPDIIILHQDGTIDIVEIKPKEMLKNADIQCKAARMSSIY